MAVSTFEHEPRARNSATTGVLALALCSLAFDTGCAPHRIDVDKYDHSAGDAERLLRNADSKLFGKLNSLVTTELIAPEVRLEILKRYISGVEFLESQLALREEGRGRSENIQIGENESAWSNEAELWMSGNVEIGELLIQGDDGYTGLLFRLKRKTTDFGEALGIYRSYLEHARSNLDEYISAEGKTGDQNGREDEAYDSSIHLLAKDSATLIRQLQTFIAYHTKNEDVYFRVPRFTISSFLGVSTWENSPRDDFPNHAREVLLESVARVQNGLREQREVGEGKRERSKIAEALTELSVFSTLLQSGSPFFGTLTSSSTTYGEIFGDVTGEVRTRTVNGNLSLAARAKAFLELVHDDLTRHSREKENIPE